MIKVVIPTVGTGSRLSRYTQNLNKSLLPYKNKPIIGHIIEQFPIDSEFYIPVGYQKNQVISVCNSLYGNRRLKFIDVDKITESDAGTAYTLKMCEKYLKNEFWYISCDTYFDEQIGFDKIDSTTYFVKKVDNYNLYTNFICDSNKNIIDISFKSNNIDVESAYSFTGLMFIKDSFDFFKQLKLSKSTEFIFSLPSNANLIELNSWIDMGNINDYENAVNKSQVYNFSKSDEITWVTENNVAKWNNNHKITTNRAIRAWENSDVVPEEVTLSSVLSYKKVKGTTLYDSIDYSTLFNLLNWLHKDVWKQVPIVDQMQSCHEFYLLKSQNRINEFIKKDQLKIESINGTPVKHWSYYFNQINWKTIYNKSDIKWIHGDLQFDNIIITPSGDFKLIDWRDKFGIETLGGDVYYDIAKLIGGCIINYAEIKQGNFQIHNNGSSYEIYTPSCKLIDAQSIIQKWAITKGYNISKIKTLVPLIYWNMAPLHTPPFDNILWCKGLLLFSEIFQ